MALVQKPFTPGSESMWTMVTATSSSSSTNSARRTSSCTGCSAGQRPKSKSQKTSHPGRGRQDGGRTLRAFSAFAGLGVTANQHVELSKTSWTRLSCCKHTRSTLYTARDGWRFTWPGAARKANGFGV